MYTFRLKYNIIFKEYKAYKSNLKLNKRKNIRLLNILLILVIKQEQTRRLTIDNNILL